MFHYKTLYSRHGYIKFYNKLYLLQFFGGKKNIQKNMQNIFFSPLFEQNFLDSFRKSTCEKCHKKLRPYTPSGTCGRTLNRGGLTTLQNKKKWTYIQKYIYYNKYFFLKYNFLKFFLILN